MFFAELDEPVRAVLADEPDFEALFGTPLLADAARYQGWLHLTPNDYDSVSLLLEELRQERARGTRSAGLLARGGLVRLLVTLCRRFDTPRAPHFPPAAYTVRHDPVAIAVRFLDACFTGQGRIKDVAASVFLSADRFTIVFAARMGRTPSDYLRPLRLERAKRLLPTTDLAILAVGRQSGFSQHKHFDVTFKSAAGMTPHQFRRQGQPQGLSGTH